jgi:hypothetical protein
MTDEASARIGEYLSDHLGGAQAAIELLDRLVHEKVPEGGSWARGLRAEIEADRTTLSRLAEAFHTNITPLKTASAWIAEKLVRPKLDLEHDAPLGLFLALEMLALGVLGKRALWTALREVGGDAPPLGSIDFDNLIRRAEAQYAQIDSRRLALAAEALTGRASHAPVGARPTHLT